MALNSDFAMCGSVVLVLTKETPKGVTLMLMQKKRLPFSGAASINHADKRQLRGVGNEVHIDCVVCQADHAAWDLEGEAA
jgi:hypothetical protein